MKHLMRFALAVLLALTSLAAAAAELTGKVVGVSDGSGACNQLQMKLTVFNKLFCVFDTSSGRGSGGG